MMTIEERKIILQMAKQMIRILESFEQLSNKTKEIVTNDFQDIIVPRELETIAGRLADLSFFDNAPSPNKHKQIKLTELKKMFPDRKITRKFLQAFLNEPSSENLIVDGVEIHLFEHGKGIFGHFVKGNYIYHFSC